MSKNYLEIEQDKKVNAHQMFHPQSDQMTKNSLVRQEIELYSR